MVRLDRFALLMLHAGCSRGEEAPLGMQLGEDGHLYAGAAVLDITPEVVETYIDADGDGEFGGCLDVPEVGVCGSGDGFNDVDGDGVFEPVWIGGFGPYRPADGVHDPITARAVVLAQDGAYIALVSLDLVGLGHPRIHDARDRLAAEGFDPDRLLVASTHNHQGPDTMGLWGDPLGIPPVSGLDPSYQQRLATAVHDVVVQAARSMHQVELRAGAVSMRELSPWFNGASFGGKNPDPILHGLIHDGRDPVLVSDELVVLQGVADFERVIFTHTMWSGHPEVWGSDNQELSSDWVGVTRDALEARYGGVALHRPESLGGMQSALGGDLPLVDEAGTWVYQTCDAEAVADPDDVDCFGLTEGADRVDADGDRVPVWAERNSWEFVRSHGWHIAQAAIEVLDNAPTYTEVPIEVDVEPLYVPVDNIVYNLLGTDDIFELGLDDTVVDTALCPEAVEVGRGCLEVRTFRGRIGPLGFVAVPGEILPELAWGLPDDAAWQAEVDDPTARGEGSTYFPQHDHDCDALSYAECQDAQAVGECDCLAVHAWPYRIADDPSLAPMLEGLDTELRAAWSMTDSYLSYVVPEPDFNRWVSLLTDDGDHYEDTVSPSAVFGTRVLEAQQRLAARD